MATYRQTGVSYRFHMGYRGNSSTPQTIKEPTRVQLASDGMTKARLASDGMTKARLASDGMTQARVTSG